MCPDCKFATYSAGNGKTYGPSQTTLDFSGSLASMGSD